MVYISWQTTAEINTPVYLFKACWGIRHPKQPQLPKTQPFIYPLLKH